jgi:hypothetical protein
VPPNLTRTLILFLNDSSIRNMYRFSNGLHPYTDIVVPPWPVKTRLCPLEISFFANSWLGSIFLCCLLWEIGFRCVWEVTVMFSVTTWKFTCYRGIACRQYHSSVGAITLHRFCGLEDGQHSNADLLNLITYDDKFINTKQRINNSFSRYYCLGILHGFCKISSRNVF